MAERLKKHETIGCCGIDCGLCPRFHTKGDSACPGCGGLNFIDKHPSCGFLTCCVRKHELETCVGCIDFPCKRFDPEKEGYDSFVTHRKVFENLGEIKNSGIDAFIVNQKVRMNFLNDLLNHYDDGRSKSFFCICCALFPLETLVEIQKKAEPSCQGLELKEKNKQIKASFQKKADELNISLKLNRRK
jgi:SUMO ligase MMS21 Smc5/6 complex component